MKAVQFAEYGDPEVLRVVEVEEPTPRADEIVVAVHAAGVNGIDWKIRAGYLQEFMPKDLPAGTGLDAAGVVTARGENVTDVEVGDAVLGNGRDTLAESAVLTSWVRKADTLSFAEAAGYPVAVETADRMLRLVGAARGQTILVSGAAGGVGSAVSQLAVERGVRVVGTASPQNHAYLRRLGVVPLSYGSDLVARARDVSGGTVHAALDVAGSGILPELAELVGEPRRVVTIADFAGGTPGVLVSTEAGDYAGPLTHAVTLARRGRFTLPVARSFPLDKAGDAHARSAEGHIAGRTVVTVR